MVAKCNVNWIIGGSCPVVILDVLGGSTHRILVLSPVWGCYLFTIYPLALGIVRYFVSIVFIKVSYNIQLQATRNSSFDVDAIIFCCCRFS